MIKEILTSKKIRRAFTLALYIGFTIALYAIFAHFTHRPFQDIHLLYAILVGCVAYMPRFIMERKQEKSEPGKKK